jgi:signal transduction histidine kinase
VALSDEPLDGTPELRVDVAVGQGAQRLHGVRMPMEGSLWGRVFRSSQPVRLSDVLDVADDTSVIVEETRVGPVLALPLQGSTEVLGVLWLGRLRERPVFTVADMEMAGSFANQAAVAIELADGRAERQRVAMLDERDRIAADLHDHVIQRLFSAGLNLQSIAGQLGRGPAADRISATIGDLDNTISQIRSSIFELHELPGARRLGVHGRLLDVIADLTPALGFEPAARFTGLSEDAVPEVVAVDLLAVLREALLNVVRHARATAAAIDLAVTADRLTLDVHDNGIGFGGRDRGGLTNMRRRAQHHGGSFSVAAAAPGTRLTWTVPRIDVGDDRTGSPRLDDS